RADAERQRQDCDEGESWPPFPQTQCIAGVLTQLIDHGSSRIRNSELCTLFLNKPFSRGVAKRVEDRGNNDTEHRRAGRAPLAHAILNGVDQAEPNVAPKPGRVQPDEKPREPSVMHDSATCARGRL